MSAQCSYCGSQNVVLEENHSSFCKDCRRSNVVEHGATDEVCIVGMGYVGTSLAAVFAESGLNVHGIDTDPDVVAAVEDERCPIAEDRISELFERHAARGNISASQSAAALDECDVIIVTVGTPLAEKDPDLSSVEAASEQVGQHLSAGDLVMFRSTLPAGATEDAIRPTLDEASGLTAGDDYTLAFCPERMAEGSAYDDMTSLPVVVGALTESGLERAEQFWESIGNETVSVSSPRAAELTKLADNWWIDLNIAIANEIALLAEEVGVDALEVIRAANTLPKGDHNVNILYPGAGVGGSCLVKDPWFVANLGDRHGLDLETPHVSRRVNDRMPSHVVDLIAEGLGGFEEQTVALLGYAFKSGTDDTRNTPARDIVDLLDEQGIDIHIADPYVKADTLEAEVGLSPLRLPRALEGVDAVVVTTGHQQYRDLTPGDLIDYVGSDDFVLVDGRLVFDPAAFDGTSVQYLGVGRGSDE